MEPNTGRQSLQIADVCRDGLYLVAGAVQEGCKTVMVLRFTVK